MNFIMKLFNIGMVVIPIVSPLIIAVICITEHFNRKYDPSQYYAYCNLLERKGARSLDSLPTDQVFERKAKAAQKREHITTIIMLLIISVSAIVSMGFLIKETAIGDWIYSLMNHGGGSILIIFAALVLLFFLIFFVSFFIYAFVFCGIQLVRNRIRGRVRRFASMVKIKEYSEETTK